MKKSTKLLSVFLAVIMILSTLTVGAFAAKSSYQTVANLDALHAYSPYGQVTRIPTEARASMILDALDKLLAPMDNLNMGVVWEKNILIEKISIYINLTSVDEICKTISSIKKALGGVASLASGLLGIAGKLDFSTWPSSAPSRANNTQLDILSEFFQLLSNNTSAIDSILTDGIDLGLANSALSSLDTDKINGIVTNLPWFLRTLIYQKAFSRPDDDAAMRTNYSPASDQNNDTGNANLKTYTNAFVKGLFTKPMNWTSYREDEAGNYLKDYTLALPTSGTTRYFTKSEDGKTITQFDYNWDTADWDETVSYTRKIEYPGADTYVFRAPEGYDGDQTLKWYKSGDAGYFLPSVRDAMNSNALTVDVNGNDNLLGLAYKFAPYLFDEMAVVVLNGSVKKLVAELFGVQFEKIGDRDPKTGLIMNNGVAVTGLPSIYIDTTDNNTVKTTTDNDKNFFTKAQEFYLWEYTDYIVDTDGTPYYRYQEEYFKGILPKDLSSYYAIFNWNFHIDGDWANEFIPGQTGCTRTRILPALNDFIGKAIKTVILPSFTIKGTTYSRDEVFAWTAGDLDKLANNILNVARQVFPIAPEEIIDDYYYEAQFYDAMMNGTINQAVNGLICEVVKLLMPQIVWPNNVIDQDMLSIAAIVVRELLTDLMPSYNFDALIYSDYNNRALLTGKDKTYWTNVVMTMGLDIGLFYLRNLADLGEDTASSYYKVMADQGALPANTAATQTYPADFDVSKWVNKVDWVIDWALSTETWGWKMQYLVGTNAALTTYQDPWAKLNTILLKILPLNQLLNATGGEYGSNATEQTTTNFLRNILQSKLVNAISNLEFDKFVSIFDVPSGYFTNNNIVDQAVKLIVYVLNGVTNTLMGGTELADTSIFTGYAALLNQGNIKTLAKNLVGKLNTMYTNHILDLALPFVNMFLGWKTSPQVYKEPILTFENSEGKDYFYTSGTETLYIENGSSDSLEKHRDGAGGFVNDSAYDIKITAVTSTDTDSAKRVTTTAALPITIAPGASTTITLKPNNTTARATTVVIAYEFTGKDGQPVGGTQYKTLTTYISSATDTVTTQPAGDYGQSGCGADWHFLRSAYPSQLYIKTAAELANTALFTYTNQVKHTSWVISASQNAAPAAELQMITANWDQEGGYVHGTDDTNEDGEEDARNPINGWADTVENGSNVVPIKALKVKDGVELVSGSAYSGGKLKIKFGNKKGNKEEILTLPTIYYYNVSELEEVFDKTQGVIEAQLDTSKDGCAAAYSTYTSALNEAAAALFAPKDYSNFAATYAQSRIETLTTNLQAAYDALVDGGYLVKANAETNRKALYDTLYKPNTGLENRADGQDYDFADFELYEYFKYEKQRTETRNMINALTKPSAPEKYIDGEGLSQADIETIIAAQTNANIATGINYTFRNPSQEAMDSYNAAVADWKPANYSKLEIDNQISLITFYYNIMKDNPRDLTASYQKQFLVKEIAYADATYGHAATSDTYTAATWKAYTDAYDNAVAVNDDSSKLPSQIFDAKYQLMIAQHDLLKKNRSMLEDGQNYLDRELTGLIANANTILENLNYYDVVAGMTQEEALGTLVKALGVRYTLGTGEKAWDGILYDHSAYTFTDYDRVDSTKNRNKVDGMCEKLQAAIDNFVCNVVINPKQNQTTVTDVEPNIKYIMGITPGAVHGLADLTNYIEGSVPEAVLNPAASAAGLFGTGATVTLNIPAIGDLAIYKVLIFGDVDGDGAIDSFDAFNIDKAANSIITFDMDDVYGKAADIAGSDGLVTIADYGVARDYIAGTGTINQTVA